MTSPTTKRIVIYGGGLAGLSLAVALQRLNSKASTTGVRYSVLVVASAKVEEDGQHVLLWRWALEALLDELGVGGGLGRVAAPIVASVTLSPLDISTPLASFPPVASKLSSAANSSSLPPLVAVRRCDLLRVLLRAMHNHDSVNGTEYLPQPANNSGLVDPTFEDELDADLAEGRWFDRLHFASLLEPNLLTNDRLKLYYIHPTTGKVSLEFRSGRTETCDMLIGADGANSSVRKLMYLNVTKQRSLLLPTLTPTAPPTSHPRPAEFSGAAVFCGVTRLHVPPTDAPDQLPASHTPIDDLRRFDVQEFVPDGRSVTLQGTVKGGWFGCTNLGNGMLGWRLVIPQEEKGAIAAGFAAMKNRELMNEAIKTNPKAGQNIMSMMGGGSIGGPLGGAAVEKGLGKLTTDETNPEDKWSGSGSAGGARKPGKLRMADTTPTFDDDDENNDQNTGEGGSDDAPKSARRKRRSIDMSALQTALKPAMNMPPRLFSADELTNRPSSTTSSQQRATFVPSSLFATSSALTGAEIRGLALKYAELENFPHPIYAIIARTDPTLTHLSDTLDLADTPLDTFTLPNPLGPGFPTPTNLHRGRVLLIGDAAHPISTNAGGSISPSLAITDAVLLAKLIAKYTDARWVPQRSGDDEILTPDTHFSTDGFDAFMAQSVTQPQHGSDDSDEEEEDPQVRHERTVYEHIATDFDTDRVHLSAEIMREARSESGRFHGPLGAKGKALINHSVVKGLWRMGKGFVAGGGGGAGKGEVGASEQVKETEESEMYVGLMKRGSVKKGLPSLV
ncbi:hypothetical protein HDU98_012339 [Podochytrium sp. JEL0797]|nr:hypothetical protein HDU98_012339 [Podochytrium sp. JEL0797]